MAIVTSTAVYAEQIPPELQELPQWVLWRTEPGSNGKPTKVPYQPNGRKASSKKPATRNTFEEVIKALDDGDFDGIGFVLTGDDGFIIWDLDNAIDTETGEIMPWADRIVEQLNSYTEVSPSGTGLHVVCRAELPKERLKGRGKRKAGDVEMFVKGFYVTFTGRHLSGTPKTIEHRDAECVALFDKTFTDDSSSPSPDGALAWDSSMGGNDFDDSELIAKALAAKDGGEFASLWAGGIPKDKTHSEADYALLRKLAFWTGKDPERMDRLFRQSSLYREKWERADYRELTITKAIRATKDVYDPNFGRKSAFEDRSLKPKDLTDVGQAAVLADVYGDILRFVSGLGWIRFDGKRWIEDDIGAQGLAQKLTEGQLQEARAELHKANGELLDADEAKDEDKMSKARKAVKVAQAYHKFALQRRASSRIEATLREARPMLVLDVSKLDADPYLFNTPSGTIDLRTGGIRPHDPNDFITKMTAAGPSDEGKELWESHLRTVTCGDNALEHYLQLTAGVAAVGKIYEEKLFIPYGDGNNGKSTHYNTLGRVMGDYAGGLSADVLTVDRRRNKGPEYAELRGKRLVIASELDEGQRLDTATVKRLCSTDDIRAEKKFRDPFDFTPSHTIVLHTNHLPRVGTTDEGTWRRLAVIPFKAKIPKDSDVKNYADFLFEHAGGAVLSWIVEGARRFIEAGHRLQEPQSVKQAVTAYRNASDWLNDFLSDRCEIGDEYVQKSGELYVAYREHSRMNGAYVRHARDFKSALERAGYRYHRTSAGVFVHGLKLRAEAELDFDDEIG